MPDDWPSERSCLPLCFLFCAPGFGYVLFFFLLLWFFGFGFVLFRCPNDVVGNVSAARGLCQYWHNTLFTRSQAGQEGGAKEERSEQRR